MLVVFSKVSLRWYLFPRKGWDAMSDIFASLKVIAFCLKKKTNKPRRFKENPPTGIPLKHTYKGLYGALPCLWVSVVPGRNSVCNN